MKQVSGFFSILAFCAVIAGVGCSGGGSKGENSPASSSAKVITAFGILGESGTIDESVKTIALPLPSGTIVKDLIPEIKYAGSSISPASGISQNFSSPVIYTVTAADGSTQAYTVTVTVAANNSKAITAFSFTSPAAAGTITESTHTIAVTVPFSTAVTALTPTITHTGASISPASGVSKSFASPVIYTVTAADGSTQAYTVTVVSAAASVTLDITSAYILSGGTKTLTATVLPATAYQGVTWSSSNSLVASLSATTGASITVTGIAAGSSAITVTTVDGLNKAAFLVYVASTSPVIIGSTGSGVGATTTYTLPTGTVFSTKEAVSTAVSSIFPTGLADNTTAQIPAPFVMAETLTTYELWSTVKTWATNHGYTFANPGQMGSDSGGAAHTAGGAKQPVTAINWRDAMIWCNALTEYYNANNGAAADIDCVYYADSTYATPLRISTTSATITYAIAGTQDDPYIKASSTYNTDMVNCTAKGFRLPTSNEYEYAARYRGSDPTNTVPGYTSYFTKGNSASGATASYSDATATSSVAVYGVSSTAVVTSKTEMC